MALCMRTDPEQCQRVGRWSVGFRFWATGRKGAPANGMTGLRVCDSHKLTLKVDDVISDESWAGVVAGFVSQHRAPPERSLTDLVFCAVH